MKSVAVLFLRGGAASTAIQPMEIFVATGILWNLLSGEEETPYFKVTTASADGKPVRTDQHLSLSPECSFEDLEAPDLIFVPAGGLEFEVLAKDGYDIDAVIARNPEAVEWLPRWAKAGSQVAAVCSGVALPAAAGLLDGKCATAHWGLAEKYRQRFPEIDWREEYLVTDAGDIYCGGGINAAADLSLYLVEKFCGREVAAQSAKSLLIEMPRTWQNAFTHFSLRSSHDDLPILRAQEWLQHHYAEDVRFDALAKEVGMSSRNFARRFKQATGDSPLNYLHSLRIAMAKQLLEGGSVTIQEIAERTGYIDLIFFRNLFKRHTGVSPNEYRKRFGAGSQLAAAQ
jgi:transcriptional regulator GlxA family with amidase domain